MGVSHVQLFSVPVSDQERSREFYVTLLGFVVIGDAEMGPGTRWLALAPPGDGETAITLVTWFDTMAPGSLKGMVFDTPSLAEDVARLRAAGVTVSDEQVAPWGTFVTFDDPDGNGIVLRAVA